MPEHDDADEDPPFGAPLPPDDRLWRHPSEMNEEGGKQQIILVSKSSASIGRTALIAAVAGLIGAAATIAFVLTTDAFVKEKTGITSTERVNITPPGNPDDTQLAIAERVLPSLARVEATGPNGVVNGTAVVFRSDGLLITTADTVNAAENLTVYFNDGTKLDGENVKLKGKSTDADIALLWVNRTDLQPAVGSKSKVTWGARTVMIDASPQTRGPEIKVGLVTKEVTAVSRGEGNAPVFGLVQVTTRASVTPRGPGSVFVDDTGSVVGLVTSRAEAPATNDRPPDTAPGTTINSALDTANALHFGLPGDFVWDIAGQLADKGVVVKPWIGLPQGQDVTDTALLRDGVGGGGMKITFFEADSPARTEGKLRTGDVIVAIDKDNVSSYNDFVAALRRHRPGDQIDITYIRDSDVDHTLVTVGGKPEGP